MPGPERARMLLNNRYRSISKTFHILIEFHLAVWGDGLPYCLLLRPCSFLLINHMFFQNSRLGFFMSSFLMDMLQLAALALDLVTLVFLTFSCGTLTWLFRTCYPMFIITCSKFPVIYMYTYVCICVYKCTHTNTYAQRTLLVLFLWRALIQMLAFYYYFTAEKDETFKGSISHARFHLHWLFPQGSSCLILDPRELGQNVKRMIYLTHTAGCFLPITK